LEQRLREHRRVLDELVDDLLVHRDALTLELAYGFEELLVGFLAESTFRQALVVQHEVLLEIDLEYTAMYLRTFTYIFNITSSLLHCMS
jgi:hypothetical protein